MSKIKLIVLVLFFSSVTKMLPAQNFKSPIFSDELILKIPDSLTTNTDDISDYINLIFKSEQDKIRAIYVWVTNNIDYDIENKYKYGSIDEEVVPFCLKTRKGTCRHYAALFSELAVKSGIQSYVVSGYTKKNGIVNCEPHSWSVAGIDAEWFMFDPTMGAGTIQYSEFAKQLDDSYFKMRPEKIIKTHMPFDPLWQFLDYPVTNADFKKHTANFKRKKQYFNFGDTLLNYQKQTTIERLKSGIQRIENNGINSYLISLIIQQYKTEIDNIYYEEVVSKYDSAVIAYKEGVYMLNRFIDYRNNQFKPDKSDQYIKQKLDSVESSIILSKTYLDSIEKPNLKMRKGIEHLYKSLNAVRLTVNEQKVFLEKYFNTPKNYRKSLFYNKM